MKRREGELSSFSLVVRKPYSLLVVLLVVHLLEVLLILIVSGLKLAEGDELPAVLRLTGSLESVLVLETGVAFFVEPVSRWVGTLENIWRVVEI